MIAPDCLHLAAIGARDRGQLLIVRVEDERLDHPIWMDSIADRENRAAQFGIVDARREAIEQLAGAVGQRFGDE